MVIFKQSEEEREDLLPCSLQGDKHESALAF